jgi:hypothetical protein
MAMRLKKLLLHTITSISINIELREGSQVVTTPCIIPFTEFEDKAVVVEGVRNQGGGYCITLFVGMRMVLKKLVIFYFFILVMDIWMCLYVCGYMVKLS